MTQDVNELYRSALLNLKTELAKAHGRQNRSNRHNGATLERIEAALERLDRRTFGYCRRCSLLIPHADLLRHPYEERCRQCQARPEVSRPPRPARSNVHQGGHGAAG